jgi:hypothetical protein
MDGFLIQQGIFTSTGNPVILSLPAGVDFITVDNLSVIGTNPNPGQGYSFRWQNGMVAGDAFETYNTNNALTLQERVLSAVPLTSGFTLINQGTDPVLGAATASTGITNVVQPVVTVGATAGFGPAGSIVTLLISQTAAQIAAAGNQGLLGIPFDFTVTNGTTFTMAPTLQQAQGQAANNATVRQVLIGSVYFPSTRYIVNINIGAPLAPVITTSVAHGYTAGQKVIFFIPSTLNGMTQMSSQVGTITNVGSNYTFTVDINATGFSAFIFPTAAQLAAVGNVYTPAQVAPYGENTAFAIQNNLNVLADAAHNLLLTGVKLGAGIHGPAGVNGNQIFWRAWKAYNLYNAGQNVNQNPNP